MGCGGGAVVTGPLHGVDEGVGSGVMVITTFVLLVVPVRIMVLAGISVTAEVGIISDVVGVTAMRVSVVAVGVGTREPLYEGVEVGRMVLIVDMLPL
jgi:hypothetical protein